MLVKRRTIKASEAVLVFAELGRWLVPGPVIWSALAARWIPEVALGQRIVTGLDRFVASSEPLLVECTDSPGKLCKRGWERPIGRGFTYNPDPDDGVARVAVASSPFASSHAAW